MTKLDNLIAELRDVHAHPEMDDKFANMIANILERQAKALDDIEKEHSVVESESTGMRQYFKTSAAYSATKAKADVERMLGDEQ